MFAEVPAATRELRLMAADDDLMLVAINLVLIGIILLQWHLRRRDPPAVRVERSPR